MIVYLHLFALLASAMGQGCEQGWVENPGLGKCYNLTWDTKNNKLFERWEDAVKKCDELDAELVSVHSATENQFIKDYLNSLGRLEFVWIGANSINRPLLDFVWVDESIFNYTNWAKGFPSELEDRYCVAMSLKNQSAGLWYNRPSFLPANPAPGLCQKTAMSICGEGWTIDPATGSCFQILPNELSWQEAQAQCMSLDIRSDLASIRTDQENEFVKNLVKKNTTTPGVQGFWTGGNDIKDEGSWVWTDGSQVEFADWHNGQGKTTKNKDCIAMWKSFDYEWKDWQCKLTLPSVCKIENKK